MTNQPTELRQTIAEQYLAAWAAPQASHDSVHAAIKSIIPDTTMTADDLEDLEDLTSWSASGADEWVIADAYLCSLNVAGSLVES